MQASEYSAGHIEFGGLYQIQPDPFGIGSGSQLLKSLAIAVIRGVTVSMLLSLVITPVLVAVLRARSPGF